MAKVRTKFVCQNCGIETAKWMGRCTNCGEWDTFTEETEAPLAKKEEAKAKLSGGRTKKQSAIQIKAVVSVQEDRLVTGDGELNRVLGGGIVPGSMVLLGGEPGIGKSTLMLQVAVRLSKEKVLYVSGEESAQQIKMRADRLGITNDNCLLLTETDLYQIFKELKAHEPSLCVIDSIQTLRSPIIESAAGSISQIRECSGELQRFAKESNVPVFIIGHITKEGQIAGPKLLEHTVDTVLQFEGDHHHTYRLLRTKKNRFGSTAELGIYEMLQDGLRQVSNPSELLISENVDDLSGISIAATLEGLRPLLIETQALVSTSAYGTPQRSATGFDSKRLNMLLAVLEKRCGFRFGDKDVFVNIAGGLKVEDPAIDLAVICALLSSFEDISLPKGIAMAGEVGLSGEIRSVSRVEQRISEADKLGFDRILISSANKGLDQSNYRIEIVKLRTVEDVYGLLFQGLGSPTYEEDPG